MMKMIRTFRYVVVLFFSIVSCSAALVVVPPSTNSMMCCCRVGGRMTTSTKINLSNKNSNNNDDDDDYEEDEEMFVHDRAGRLVDNNNSNPRSTIDALSSSSTSSSTTTNSINANYMDDLTPPPINFARDSILFSENPSTRSNSGGFKIWQSCKKNLPPVLTGAWPWRDSHVADDNPIGGLYNILFVRLPVIGVGLVYSKNLLDSHPLIVDIGQGPFEMSPLLVYGVLALILA